MYGRLWAWGLFCEPELSKNMASWCLNTCIFHMVVNSSKESLVPRNSTSTLIRSQYWDWWRLPARKVRNLKQKVCNIYIYIIQISSRHLHRKSPISHGWKSPWPSKNFSRTSFKILGFKGLKQHSKERSWNKDLR